MSEPKTAAMGGWLLMVDAISSIQNFINVFISVYVLIIFAYIIMSWVRLPYSPWLNRIQRFLYDVCDPYLRIFRRLLPSFGAVRLLADHRRPDALPDRSRHQLDPRPAALERR